MKTMKFVYATLPVLCALAAAVPAAEETQPAGAAPVELFKGPRGIDLKAPSYPQSERSSGDEGWVIVNVMIDPEGKPYEPTVVDSTGNKVFEKVALETVEKWRFEPASMNGTPIHAGSTLKLQFQLSGATGAREQFVKAYAQLVKAVDAGDRERADARLALLEAHNLYEDAYRGIAHYKYYLKWGTQSQQLAAVRRALAGEKNARYLPKDVFARVLQTALSLEIRLHDYASALRTWETLRATPLDEASRAKWQTSIDEIQALRTNDKAYTVAGDFGDRSSWFYELLKRKFQLEVASGSIAEIKLRCDRQYVFFRFDPTLQYTIAGNNKGCSMELVGQPGTKFQLTQT
jgi:TonB family protein